jgi:hypothetical protein
VEIRRRFLASLLLLLAIGSEFFPDVDAGQFRLHMRAATGTRIEETAGLGDNIGLPYSGINTSYSKLTKRVIGSWIVAISLLMLAFSLI